MATEVDFSKLKSSWTKYDIVQVMEVISSEDKLEKYLKRELKINEPILRAFLGIKQLTDTIPSYWIEIQNYPKEKKLFALFALIFTHGDIIKDFAETYSQGDMKGVFQASGIKQDTNLRSALVESGAALPTNRRSKSVPYDFSPIFRNGQVGRLFKQLLISRITRITRKKIEDLDFYSICYENKIHRTISLNEIQFKSWLEGEAINQTNLKSEGGFNKESFYKNLTDYAEELIVENGWDLAFELIQDNKNRVFLQIKDAKSPYLINLSNNDKYKTFEIPAFNKLGDDVDFFEGLNYFTQSNLQVYKQIIFNYFNNIKITLPEFIEIFNIIQKNNISYIHRVQISNFFSIKDVDLEFEDCSKEIYFLGENGDGKSLILMAIYLAFNRYFIAEQTEQDKTGKVFDIIKLNPELELSGVDENEEQYGNNKGKYLNNILAYGAQRGRCSVDNTEKYGFMSLFDSDQTLSNPVFWLRSQKLLEIEKLIGESHTKPDMFEKLPNSFSIKLLEEMFYELLEKNVEIKIEGGGVTFIEKGVNLKFDQLSEGYKSILIFVSDLIYRLNQNENEGKSTSDLRGVVLVDEIDLHLHPKWQRVIVKKLRRLFPNVQFIFSTHSPTIIQGASDDAIIFRVYRNSEDGKTRVSEPYYRKDLDHLMINTLVTSPLFGLDDSRMNSNDDTADTSDTYLLYRINKKIEDELTKQKMAGKKFISDDEIDQIIQNIMNFELGSDDKD